MKLCKRSRLSVRACLMVCLVGGTVDTQALAQGPYPVEWARQVSTPQIDVGFAMAVDPLGNTFIAGETEGDLAGSLGAYDAFVRKLDSSGNTLWTKQFGSSQFDAVYGVAADASGNAYLAGHTNNAASNFVTKLDAVGDVVWSKMFSGSQTANLSGVAVDPGGNVYFSGTALGNLFGTSSGDRDIVVGKLDPAGNTLWTQQFGSTTTDYGRAVSFDASGNLYVTGTTQGDLVGSNAGSNDVILAKFDTAGAEVWSRQLGTGISDNAWALTSDDQGNAYLAGYREDSTTVNSPDEGVLVIKTDSDGNTVWSKVIDAGGLNQAYGIALDPTGNLLVSGRIDGKVMKLDPNGDYLWSSPYQANGSDVARDVGLDADGNIYFGGGTFVDRNGFVAKLTVPEPTSLALLGLGGLAVIRRRRG